MKFTDRRVFSPESKTILVVDDDAPVRLLVSCILNQAGYDVVIASDGIDAMMRIDGGCHFDLLLTDLAMPVIDGIKLAAHVSRARPGTPVAFMSGFLDSFPNAIGLNVMTKPFTPGELLDAVQQALSKAMPVPVLTSPHAPACS